MSCDAIEERLLALGCSIATDSDGKLRHSSQDDMPEWYGAHTDISSDPEYQERTFSTHVVVRTRHAGQLSRVFFELRDAFWHYLNAGNKYDFFGCLGESALAHLAANQPESEDHRPLLKAVLSVGFEFLESLRRHHHLPGGAMVFFHCRDDEGRHFRIPLG